MQQLRVRVPQSLEVSSLVVAAAERPAEDEGLLEEHNRPPLFAQVAKAEGQGVECHRGAIGVTDGTIGRESLLEELRRLAIPPGIPE